MTNENLGPKVKRPIPAMLPGKLRAVRLHLLLTQSEMAARLWEGDARGASRRTKNVCLFERGGREPTLDVLLRYAREGGVTVETLIDDRISLPADYAQERARVARGRRRGKLPL